MKKLIFAAVVAIFTLASAAVSAATPFFLDKQGAVAEYVVKGANGDVQSYVKMTVTEIDYTDNENFRITYSTEVFDKDHKSLAAAVTSSAQVKDGAVDVGQAMEGVEFEGEFPSYPANLSVGQVMEYSFSMKTMGMKSTVEGKNTVAARENVSTEAGSFDCFRIDGEASAKALMSNVKTKTVSWISAGVGAVKTETYDNRDRLQSVQELVSISK
ncbi:MAG: hypothetical protein LBV38_08015 [Alistipes sp.]|jgi:hypothetical protein|nr:hypothetical protein [Alistipes sp.]